MQKQTLRALLVAAVLATALTAAASVPAAPHGGQYTVTPLVSDVPGAAPTTDPNLVNGWGLARSPTSPWWVADNGPEQVDALHGRRHDQSARRRRSTAARPVPSSPESRTTSPSPRPRPRRWVRRASSSRPRTDRSARGAAATTALVTAHGGPGAVYKGLAIAQPTPGQPLLYATDFHNARVDVFNGAWRAGDAAGRVRRPEPAGRLRPVRDPDDRFAASSSPTRSRMRTPTTRSPARAVASSTPTTSRGTWSRASRSTAS